MNAMQPTEKSQHKQSTKNFGQQDNKPPRDLKPAKLRVSFEGYDPALSFALKTALMNS